MSADDLITADLRERADKIDRRLGPITGRDADSLAALLRKCAEKIDELHGELKVARAEGWERVK